MAVDKDGNIEFMFKKGDELRAKGTDFKGVVEEMDGECEVDSNGVKQGRYGLRAQDGSGPHYFAEEGLEPYVPPVEETTATTLDNAGGGEPLGDSNGGTATSDNVNASAQD